MGHHFYDVTMDPRIKLYRTRTHVFDIVYQRDEGICQICGKILDWLIHHIDHDSSNDSEYNLCVLCRSCNSSINCSDKQYWIDVLTNKVLLKYKKSDLLPTQSI